MSIMENEVMSRHLDPVMKRRKSHIKSKDRIVVRISQWTYPSVFDYAVRHELYMEEAADEIMRKGIQYIRMTERLIDKRSIRAWLWDMTWNRNKYKISRMIQHNRQRHLVNERPNEEMPNSGSGTICECPETDRNPSSASIEFRDSVPNLWRRLWHRGRLSRRDCNAVTSDEKVLKDEAEENTDHNLEDRPVLV